MSRASGPTCGAWLQHASVGVPSRCAQLKGLQELSRGSRCICHHAIAYLNDLLISRLATFLLIRLMLGPGRMRDGAAAHGQGS